MFRSNSSPEEPEEGKEGLRDHVHVGLDVPIRVWKHSSVDGHARWWYYVTVELSNGKTGEVGLVKQREEDDYWVAQAAPGYGTVHRADTRQEAIDGLVRYGLEMNVEFRGELREETEEGWIV